MSNNALLLVARILLVVLFLISGAGMASAPGGVAGYFGSLGIPAPGLVVWLVVALKIVAGIAIIVGLGTRYAAWAMAAFTVAAAVIGHNNFADQQDLTQFLKDLAIAGGFLLLTVTGPGAISVEGRQAAA